MFPTEIWWSNSGGGLAVYRRISFFLQMDAQRHCSRPYVTRKASFYAGIEQELHSTIEWCGQFRTCLCWYRLVRDSRRGHSMPNGQCLLRLNHPSIHPSIPTFLSMHECMHRHCVSEPLLSILLWVAGGNCVPKRVMVKRIRCDRHRGEPIDDLTLP